MSKITFRVNPAGLAGAKTRLMHLAEASAITVVNEVKTTMDPGPPRTGNRYSIPGTQKLYTASAPGEPPAIREGAYRDSWQHSPAVDEGRRIVARAFTGLQVDGWVLGDLLEHGTYRMAPRPHVRTALHSVLPQVQDLVRQASGG